MDLGIRGRVAVVAASTGGLGRAVAEALAAEGASVVVAGRRGDLAEEIAGGLPDAVGVRVDLTVPDGPRALVEAAREAYGDPDILVLNGPGPRPGTAAGLDTGDLAAAVDSLLLAQQRLVALTLPSMRRRGWGRILAVGSSGIAEPLPGLVLSNAGRAALAAYLKTLAAEVATDGVTVNLLLPGRIATDRVAALDAARAEREQRPVAEVEAASQAAIPAGRYGTPAEFGAAAAFLCSAPASYITGTALRCDGGLVRGL
ncbi:SDR family oxidoreductase [Streptomyces cellulosae]|uniref:SDR family oxidoreductase n=2 Tax=Streptomyces TaxID=1883 RepID=A0ABU3J8A8_9ACTN|nr:SDR family oxidoreductase [Streptomyces sp. McG7]MBT2903117.1 SDR family oxidoreductase [Streptomyces sp. McG8]MDQ0487752.1 3-oxoacyl-[acyl-carrier protein] reductase [Streptomyces thermodiastaticus]MDT6971294.1 SDR family oxidoreductase [Streptomyces thermocarboxydus]MYW50373.1 SDR family oxidoreductase [Streptomyces sp. SID8376]THC58607.1 SDR family oxidoreductase [Streptomyces sp. Akac8]WSB45354.1 SDR family oxidoreductase [Streptomyces cellulosae]